MITHKALLFQQYRTVDPVHHYHKISASTDEEAVGKAIRKVDEMGGFRYGVSLKAVARCDENGEAKTIIFEDGRYVEKSIKEVLIRK